ncbi:MAG: serine/threonine protein kinase [Bradymonadaceae bacterium]|nr:serine/threonine protein kinase [Lujinxingiaceae bacterium]
MVTQPNAMAPRKRRPTKPIDAPQTLIGRVLDERYRLERVLNAGGMGIIFEATQLNVSRRVAVKLLKPTLTSDPALIKRFSLEVELVASLTHPNIVALIDSGQDPSGLTYLVMEFVEGMTFREALKHTQLTLSEIVDVFAQTSNALIETHARGIIHRDLKFDNIMLVRMRDGRLQIKLLDFGVAKLLSRDGNLTLGGQVAGTPGIIAPELVDGELPGPRSDLYSMGVLLFTALSGNPPFKAANDLELMRAHKTLALPSLKQLVGSTVPEELIELASELLEKDPKRRPADARLVRDRLELMGRGLRKRFPDQSPYRPSVAGPLFFDEEPLIVSEASLAFDDEDERASEPELIRRVFKEPVIAPFSIVAALSLVLMLLVVIIIYTLYSMWVMGQPV